MGNKKDYSQIIGNISQTQREMQSTMQPKWGAAATGAQGLRSGIASARSAPRTTADYLGAKYKSWADTDPTSWRVDPSQVSRMRAGVADTAGGARSAAIGNINKQIAAQGMGDTGAGMRAAMKYDRGMSRDLMGQNREISTWADKENFDREQAARSWAASGAGALGNLQSSEDLYQQNMWGLEGNALNQEMGALQGESGMYRDVMDAYTPIMQATAQKNRPGFWGTVGNSFAQSLGNTLGGGNISIAKRFS